MFGQEHQGLFPIIGEELQYPIIGMEGIIIYRLILCVLTLVWP